MPESLAKYKLTIEDFQSFRRPDQTIMEVHIVEAVTAADAITIGQVRHNFPFSESRSIDSGWEKNRWTDSHWRKLRNVEVANA